MKSVKLHEMKKVEIVVKGEDLDFVIDLLERAGVSGYTIIHNVEAVLEGITPFLNKHSGVVFVSSVMVSRIEKFGGISTSAGRGS